MAFNWGNAAQGASSLGGIGLLGGFLGDNDYEKDTNNILNKIPPQLREFLMPYINAGTGALGKAGGEYDKLLADPNALISRLGAGYKASPGYQWKLNQGENAITNAQAAGGMAGSGQHQQLAGQLAENLANQDYYDYLKDVLGLFGTGLQGEQGLTELGAGAGGSLAASLAAILQDKAKLRYQGGLNKNQQLNDIFSNIGSMGKNIGSIFTGGSM